jgi:hypothetical protein
VITFGTTPPTSTGSICSSWDGTSAQWTPLSSSAKKIRPLFSVRVKDLIYDKTSSTPPVYSDSTTVWYGYELRTNYFAGKARPANFEIWRITCGGVTPVRDAKQDLNLITLGSSTNISGYDPSGSTILKCVSSTAGVETSTNCPENSSTYAYSYYSLKIPYIINAAEPNSTEYHQSIKRFVEDSTLQTLKRRIQVVQ